MINKILYTILCRTGCTCCQNENFHEGFFEDESIAMNKINEYRKGVGYRLASQYAKYGLYSLYKHDAEILPDGRVIIGSHVFDNSDYQSNLCSEYEI